MDIDGDHTAEEPGSEEDSDSDMGDQDEIESLLPEMRRNKNWLDPPVINLFWAKAFKREDLLSQMMATLLRHPRDYMATLVRLGFEPLPGQTSTSLIRRQAQLRLPGFFTYLGYIAKTDGFFGIFRGLHYNLAYAITYEFMYKNINNLQIEKIKLFEPVSESPEAVFDSPRNLALNLARDIGSRLAAHVVTYPLKVIAIRSMAQFVGGETFYDSWLGAIANVYNNGGFGAFYGGFVPFCLAESLYVSVRWTVFYLMRNKLDRSKRASIFLGTTLLMDSAANPLRTVSTVMACNGQSAQSLAAANFNAPAYNTWIQCLLELWTKGEASRGSSLFYRTRPLTKSFSVDEGNFHQVEQCQ